MSKNKALSISQDLRSQGYTVTVEETMIAGYYVEVYLQGDLMMGSGDYYELYDALIAGTEPLSDMYA